MYTMPLLSFSPPVTALGSDTGVTRLTKSHEVTLLVASALGKREDVVYLLGGCERSLLLAILAERVRLDVAVTNTLPGAAVSFVGIGVAFMLVVAFVHDLLMLGTVLLTHGEPTAAGVSTGTLRFVGHRVTSFGHKKSPQGLLPEGSSLFFFAIIILS
jgi:hypothetical protein